MEIDSINGKPINVVPPTPEKGYTYYFSYNDEKWIKMETHHESKLKKFRLETEIY